MRRPRSPSNNGTPARNRARTRAGTVLPSMAPSRNEPRVSTSLRTQHPSVHCDHPKSDPHAPLAMRARRGSTSMTMTPVAESRVVLPAAEWDMVTFDAPDVMLRSMRELAEAAWLEQTGYVWGSTHKLACRRRAVLPLRGMCRELATMVAVWLRTVGSTHDVSARVRAILLRPQKHMIVDIMESGAGFCPPGCGSLGLHRDGDDGLTLLVALDPIYESGGSIVFLPQSEEVPIPLDVTARSFRLVSDWQYAYYITGSANPGACWLFPSATLHWGRNNVLHGNWRIVYNVVLGSSGINAVDEIRL